MPEKQYRVIKPYRAESYPVTLPVGTILEWWPDRQVYLSRAVNGVCVGMSKWAVEAWHNYFEPVEVEKQC